jgi:hypothetical protein
MAIIYRNPMPMSGAFFIENPRKRKAKPKRRKNAIRINGPKAGMVAKYLGISRKQYHEMNKSKEGRAQIQAAFKAAGGQSTLAKLRGEKLPDGRRAGRAFGTALGRLKKKYAKAFNDPAKRKKIERAFFAGGKVTIDGKTFDPRAEAGLMGDTVGRYSIVKTAKKASSSRKKAASKPARRATAKKASSKGESLELTRTQNGRYRLGNKFISKADAANLMGVDVESLELMAINNPRGRKMRRNAWFNDTAGHRKAALKGWRKRRAAMKKKKKAPAKRKARKSVAKKSKSVAKRKSAKAVSATRHKSLLKKAHKAVAKKKFRSPKSRMKAVWAEYKKLAKGKSSGKKAVAKATRRKARVASKKRAVARKASKWQKFLKKMGNRGLSREQLRRLYKKSKAQQDVIAKQFPKIRKKKGATAKRRRAAKSRRGAIRVSKARKGKGRGAHQAVMGPYMARLNPKFSIGGLLSRAEGFVENIPVVRSIAPAVIPIALGAGVYYVHQLAEPYVMPLVTKVGGAAAKIPVIGKAVPFLLSKPYTMTGLVAAGALALLNRYDLISKQDAAMVGGTAIAMGVGLDLSLKPFAEAAVAVQEQVAAVDPMAAQEEIAIAEADAMAGAHMGAVHMGSVHLSGLASDYADAHFGDAYVCGEDLHPEEIAAAVAGQRYFFNKFGKSPQRITGKQSIYSRHAGRQGHRFGWLIKMIGFANFQKIAALPPHQRRQVIARLRKKAMAAVPQAIAAAQAAQPALESASLPIDGASNGAGGVDGANYGALMFAGNGY